MAGKMNRWGYQKLVDEDVAWLEQQPRTLERDHVIKVVKESVEAEYGKAPEGSPAPATTSRYTLNPDTHQYECSCGAAPADLHFVGDHFIGCDACCPKEYLSEIAEQRRHAASPIRTGPTHAQERRYTEHRIKIGDAFEYMLECVKRGAKELNAAREQQARTAFGLERARAESEALAGALREQFYPSFLDGEPLDRCLDSLDSDGNLMSVRCHRPRTYDYHCDEHRRGHETEERRDAPLIRALAAYEASQASAGAATEAYVDRVAELEAALAEERRLRTNAETRVEALSRVDLDPTSALLDALGIEAEPIGRLPARVQLAIDAADARTTEAVARANTLQIELDHAQQRLRFNSEDARICAAKERQQIADDVEVARAAQRAGAEPK